MITIISLSSMFGMKILGYSESGAMGSMISGIISSYCWSNNYPCNALTRCGTANETVHNVQRQISIFWDIAIEPLLFGSIGCALDLNLIPSDSLIKGVCIVCVGLAFRLGGAYLATSNGGLTPKERLFIAISWLPKATVQAALCTFPLIRVQHTLSPEQHDYQKYIDWAEQILSTAILSICITAPLGVILIKYLGKILLQCDEHHHNNDDIVDEQNCRRDVTSITPSTHDV
jgi:NhaP-type Na+/H+ or K+/H+ antiporter